MINTKIRNQIQSIIRHKVMFNTNTTGKIDVIDAEPGVGKTRAIIDVVPNFINADPNNKVLIVTPFRKEKTNGEFIADAINQAAGRNIAVGIDSKNIRRMKSLSEQFPVVVITRKRYRELSKNPDQQRVLGEGRVHIIDETVNHVEPLFLSIQDLNDLELVIPKPVDMDFRRITGPIRDVLMQNVAGPVVLDLSQPSDFDVTIKRIIGIVDSTYTKEYLAKLSVDTSIKFRKQVLIEKIVEIGEFYNKRIFSHRDFRTGVKKVFTFDSKVSPYVANHNLMINASASINKQFESDVYNVIESPRARDYSRFTLHICSKSSSKQSINNIKDFEETALEYIEGVTSANDDVLILSYKNQVDKLKKQPNVITANNIHVDIVHNMVGTNIYESCNKVFILGTPSISGEAILLNYQYYINKEMKVSIKLNKRLIKVGNISEDVLSQMTEIITDLYTLYPNKVDFQRCDCEELSQKVLITPMKIPESTLDVMSETLMKMYEKPVAVDMREDVPLEMIRKDRKISYVFKELEDYRVREIVDRLNQALLRINRNGTQKSDVYIMNSNDEVIKKLTKTLPGVNVVYDFDIDFNQQRKSYDNSNRQASSSSAQFIELIQELEAGEYKKADIRKQLNMTYSSDLTRVLKNAEVVDFMERNNIISKGQKIIKP